MTRLRSIRRAAPLLAVAMLAACSGRKAGDADDGAAATSDDLGSSAAGSAISNDSLQRGRAVNDTLPGRDSRPRQPAGISDTTRRP